MMYNLVFIENENGDELPSYNDKGEVLVEDCESKYLIVQKTDWKIYQLHNLNLVFYKSRIDDVLS